jgi:hypothetical protein
MQHSRRTLLAGALALAGSLILTSASAVAAPTWTFNTVVMNLKNPRGIAFDDKGAMYVAEAGVPGAESGDGVTQTGAVDKYKRVSNTWSKSWSKSFNSAYTHAHGAPESLGPSGMSAHGGKVLMIMALSSHEVPLPQFGHLYQLNPANGNATDRGDVGDQQWEWANNHKYLWSEFPDTNPYGVLIARGEDEVSENTVFVVDAGANTVSRVSKGVTKVIAYIPNEQPVPGRPNFPVRDSTPTCAALGPDGALYVGTLDLFRNFADPNQGWSHVYRIELDEDEGIFEAAKVWASGLTTITGCAFDRSGNLWATEMFKNNTGGPPGDLVRIPFANPGQKQHIGGGRIPFPGGVVQGPDGAMYVTVNSASSTTNDGKVVRVSA